MAEEKKQETYIAIKKLGKTRISKTEAIACTVNKPVEERLVSYWKSKKMLEPLIKMGAICEENKLKELLKKQEEEKKRKEKMSAPLTQQSNRNESGDSK